MTRFGRSPDRFDSDSIITFASVSPETRELHTIAMISIVVISILFITTLMISIVITIILITCNFGTEQGGVT
jgi:hypothetical protein